MSRGSPCVFQQRLAGDDSRNGIAMKRRHHNNPILHTARGAHSLALLLVIPTLLVASWLWAPTRASWDSLDLIVFRSLNETLALGLGWQKFWAFANSPVFDAIAGIIVFALLVTSILERRVGRPALISLSLMAIAIMAGREIGSELVVDRWFDFHRPSPSLVHADSQRLSHLVPSIECKDASPWSFPGDHGIVVFGIAIYMSFWSRKRTARAAWLLGVLLLLPRLVSGGHWLTDIVVGSLSIAMVSVGLLMGTGFHDWAVKKIVKLFELEAIAETGAADETTFGENKAA